MALTLLAVLLVVFGGPRTRLDETGTGPVERRALGSSVVSVNSFDDGLHGVTQRLPVPAHDLSVAAGLIAVVGLIGLKRAWAVSLLADGDRLLLGMLGVRYRRRGPPLLAN